MQKLFSNVVQGDGFLCKHARGISERSGKEFHTFHEIIYFLDGDAEFISEDLHMHLMPETLIYIPMESYHQLVIHGDQRHYYRCLLQFLPDTIPPQLDFSGNLRIKAIGPDEEIKYLFGKLMDACDLPACDSPAIINAVLTILFRSLRDKTELKGTDNYQSDLIRQITNYINQNIHRKLPLAEIATSCNVSVSTLCHLFKQEMNIPIHKFIVKKRLVNAHQKILTGHPATEVAMECGFQDYSGFYKQYKKMFGVSPSCRSRL